MEIRHLVKEDLTSVKSILDSIELFPSEMLNDLTKYFFSEEKSEDIWFTAVENDTAIAIGCCIAELSTIGTYNLFALGVRENYQGRGIGKKMMAYIEFHLAEADARLLIVETSSDTKLSKTQTFLENLSYSKAAIIKDFWQEGEDKIFYSKKLN